MICYGISSRPTMQTMSSHSYRRIRRRINLCYFFLLLSFLLAVSCQAFLSIQRSSRIRPSCQQCRQGRRNNHCTNDVFGSPFITSKISTQRYAASDSLDNESNNIDANATIALNATTGKLAPSGWANIGRFLLPSWHSSSDSDAADTIQQLDAAAYNSSAIEAADSIDEPIHMSNEEDSMTDVIDVECRVDEVEDCLPQSESDASIILVQENIQSEPVLRPALTGMLKALFNGGKAFLNSTIDGETTLEVDDNAAASNTTEADSLEETASHTEEAAHLRTESVNNSTTKRNRRSRRNSIENENWLTSLESKDIDTTTRSKQRKWARRQKRLIMMAKTAKNAVVLFVITFLLGNVMNQFVDLDEDGSFEVRFGKVLSSSPPASSAPPTQAATLPPPPSPPPQVKKKTPLTKPLFQTVSTPKTNYFAEINTRSQGMTLVARAVRQVGPAVVRVETETDLDAQESAEGNGRELEQGDGEGEDRGDVFDGIPEAPPPSESNSGPRNIDFGQGSGMIVNKEGYILTNAHVVDGSNRIYITLTDGRRFRAELQGSDDIVDIAVLKIVPDNDQTHDIISNLPVAQLGDSDQLEVGQFVTAIGCPGGLDNTCTIGIISGLKRCPNTVGIPDKMGVLDYIQTDAAINQGNSGGPLVDVESGNIVGINTCIRANMEGTSFAIPTNKILAIVGDLAIGVTPTHGYIGVEMVSTVIVFSHYLLSLSLVQFD